ncbi:MAG: tyrosine-type recombinase/integrase [Sulfobacillus sp.]
MAEDSTAQTTGDFVQWWLVTIVGPGLRPATADTYRRLARLYILPRIGELPLTALTAAVLRRWTAELATASSRSGSQLSPRTVAYVQAVLRSALSEAVRLELLSANPMSLVRPPRAHTKPVGCFSLEEMRRLDAASTRCRLGPLFSFLWQSGLRIGEALALCWVDVDLAAGTLTVSRNLVEVSGHLIEGSPKSAAGFRQIVLPEQTVALLRAIRLRSIEGQAPSPLVFPNRLGTHLSRRNVTRSWISLRRDLGLPDYGLHALRHTNASLQLQAGVGIAEIAAHLGHENPTVTARTYAHVLDPTKRRAASRFGQLLARDGPTDRATPN